MKAFLKCLLVGLIVVSVCGVAVAQEAKLPYGTKAPALKDMVWVKGDAVTFEAGHIYVVEFWATWCGPCKASIPHLTEVQKKYKDKNVTVIGISDEAEEKVRPFVKQMGEKMDYIVAIDAKKTASKGYSDAFKQRGIPHAFIVDGEGKIVWVGHPMNGMEDVLDKVTEGTFDLAVYQKEQAQKKAELEKLQKWWQKYFTMIEAGGNTENAQKVAARFVSKAPAMALNQFAWRILTEVEKDKRDLSIALKAAQKAVHMTESKNPMTLDTYALALFENGNVAEAIQMQQKAVDLVKEPKIKEELQKTLKKYQDAAQKG